MYPSHRCKMCGDCQTFESRTERDRYERGHKQMHQRVRVNTERGMIDVPAGTTPSHGGSLAYIPMTKGKELIYVRPSLRIVMERKGYIAAKLPEPKRDVEEIKPMPTAEEILEETNEEITS